MTISSSTRKAGPFVGTGTATDFTFAFKVFTAADLYCVMLDEATNVETVLELPGDYTVSLNADQDAHPGGTVSLDSELASGKTLTITSAIGYLQPTDLTNQGGFYPSVITDSLDRATIQIQQLAEQVDRAPKIPLSSTGDADVLAAAVIAVAADLDNVDTVAASIADVNTVAGSITDVSTAAANITGINNFADIYYGPSATDPTARKDSSPLQYGDLYFNTATNLMRVYSSAGWTDAQTPAPVSITAQTFSGNGSDVEFVLSGTPAYVAAVEVAISGVLQVPTTNYTLADDKITFTTAPPSGTNNIFVRWYAGFAGGVPNDGSVTPAKLSTGHPTWDTAGNLTATSFAGPATNATGTGSAVKAPSENGLHILRGAVSDSGTKTLGDGFSVAHTGTGLYTITFDTAFSSTPVSTATVKTPIIGSAIGKVISCSINDQGTTSLKIEAFYAYPNTAAKTAVDLPFNFITIGPR